MSTSNIRVVAPLPPEVNTLNLQCEALAKQSALDRFEIAVTNRLEVGIQDDNDLRLTDDLAHQIVLAGDALDTATKPTISAAFALHRSLIATVKPWKDRWQAMRDKLDRAMLAYNQRKRALEARQQAELDRVVEEERRKKAAEAKAALRNGDVSAAQSLMQEAQTMQAPVILGGAPVLDNANSRWPWQVEITNPEALVKGIAAGTIPMSAIKEFDLTFLKKEAAKRGGLPATWGVSAKQEERLSHKR